MKRDPPFDIPINDARHCRLACAQFENYVCRGIIPDDHVKRVAATITRKARWFGIEIPARSSLALAERGGIEAFKQNLRERDDPRLARLERNSHAAPKSRKQNEKRG